MTVTIQTLQNELRMLQDQRDQAEREGNVGLVGDLDRKIQPMADLLGAPARKAQAARDVEALRVQADQAQGVVNAALAVVNEMLARVADAAAELTAQREQNAAAILGAAKQGKTIKANNPDRGGLLALEAALALAEGEYQAAAAALAAMQVKVSDAERELHHAERDTARLIFELALRDFGNSLREYVTAVPDYGVVHAQHEVAQRFYAI